MIKNYGLIQVYDWTPTMNTGGTDAGDIAAAPEALPLCRPIGDSKAGAGLILEIIFVIDKDDVASGDWTLYLFSSSVTLAAEDAAFAITDAEAAVMLGPPIDLASWTDLGGVKVSAMSDTTLQNMGRILKSEAGGRDIYASLVDEAGVTSTASGLVLRLGLIHT